MAYFHVTLRTGERDLHSGIYGGAALNAAHALIETLSAVTAARRPTARAAARGDRGAHRAGARGLGRCPRAPTSSPARARSPADAAAEEFYLRTFAEPALDVNGMHSGSPDAREDRAAGPGGG